MKYWIALSLFSISICVIGQNPLSPEEIEKLNKGISTMNSNTTTIQAEFAQEKYLTFLEEKVISTGSFYFQKESSIRWVYEEPSKYIIVLNDQKIYIDNNKEKKKIDGGAGKAFKHINEMIVQSISGEIAKNPNYEVEYKSYKDEYNIILTPKSKSMKAFVNAIHLYIDKGNYSVTGLKMIESDVGDYTYIKFENQRFNEKLDPAIFKGF